MLAQLPPTADAAAIRVASSYSKCEEIQRTSDDNKYRDTQTDNMQTVRYLGHSALK